MTEGERELLLENFLLPSISCFAGCTITNKLNEFSSLTAITIYYVKLTRVTLSIFFSSDKKSSQVASSVLEACSQHVYTTLYYTKLCDECVVAYMHKHGKYLYDQVD